MTIHTIKGLNRARLHVFLELIEVVETHTVQEWRKEPVLYIKLWVKNRTPIEFPIENETEVEKLLEQWTNLVEKY